VADRFNKKRVYQVWTDEEMKVIDQVMKGELLKYQAAIKLGRSIKSVRRKIERLNEERGARC
jgi:transcription initiation factor IIE alpha subunit